MALLAELVYDYFLKVDCRVQKTSFLGLSAILSPTGGYFALSRMCGLAISERAPLAQLCWYLFYITVQLQTGISPSATLVLFMTDLCTIDPHYL